MASQLQDSSHIGFRGIILLQEEFSYVVICMRFMLWCCRDTYNHVYSQQSVCTLQCAVLPLCHLWARRLLLLAQSALWSRRQCASSIRPASLLHAAQAVPLTPRSIVGTTQTKHWDPFHLVWMPGHILGALQYSRAFERSAGSQLIAGRFSLSPACSLWIQLCCAFGSHSRADLVKHNLAPCLWGKRFLIRELAGTCMLAIPCSWAVPCCVPQIVPTQHNVFSTLTFNCLRFHWHNLSRPSLPHQRSKSPFQVASGATQHHNMAILHCILSRVVGLAQWCIHSRNDRPLGKHPKMPPASRDRLWGQKIAPEHLRDPEEQPLTGAKQLWTRLRDSGVIPQVVSPSRAVRAGTRSNEHTFRAYPPQSAFKLPYYDLANAWSHSPGEMIQWVMTYE